MKLATQPTAGVSVSVSSGDTGAVAVSPASLSFSTSNWNTAKTVTVSGVHDNDTVDERVTVSLRGSGGGYTGETGSVSVRVTDDDDPSLVVSPSSLTVVEGGASGSFTVKLATRPTAGVSVSVSSGDTGAVTVSPASLSFSTSNWNTAKTVTVRGVNDPDTVDERVTVSLRGSGGGYTGETGSVSVRVTDDDGTGSLTASRTSLAVGEQTTVTASVSPASLRVKIEYSSLLTMEDTCPGPPPRTDQNESYILPMAKSSVTLKACWPGDATVRLLRTSDNLELDTIEITIATPEIDINYLASPLEIGSTDEFSVSMRNLSSAVTYNIQVTTGNNADIGFGATESNGVYTCDPLTITTENLQGSTSYMREFRLHACDTYGASVFANVLHENRIVGSNNRFVRVEPRVSGSLEIDPDPMTSDMVVGGTVQVSADVSPSNLQPLTIAYTSGLAQANASCPTLSQGTDELKFYTLPTPNSSVTLKACWPGPATVQLLTTKNNVDRVLDTVTITVLTPTVNIVSLESSMTVGSRDNFIVQVLNLLGTASYSIQVLAGNQSDNDPLGFDSTESNGSLTCDPTALTISNLSGSTLSNPGREITLHACNNTLGAQVSASVIYEGNAVGSSEAHSVAVTAGAPTQAPTQVYIFDTVGHRGLRLRWNSDVPFATEYVVTVTRMDGQPDPHIRIQTGVGVAEFTGLESYHPYIFTVAGKNSAGTGPAASISRSKPDATHATGHQADHTVKFTKGTISLSAIDGWVVPAARKWNAAIGHGLKICDDDEISCGGRNSDMASITVKTKMPTDRRDNRNSTGCGTGIACFDAAVWSTNPPRLVNRHIAYGDIRFENPAYWCEADVSPCPDGVTVTEYVWTTSSVLHGEEVDDQHTDEEPVYYFFVGFAVVHEFGHALGLPDFFRNPLNHSYETRLQLETAIMRGYDGTGNHIQPSDVAQLDAMYERHSTHLVSQ